MRADRKRPRSAAPFPKVALACTIHTSSSFKVQVGTSAVVPLALANWLTGNEAAVFVCEPTLETIILEDLRNVDGCPRTRGNVMVYGIPWNAMLTFGTAAGQVRNKGRVEEVL